MAMRTAYTVFRQVFVENEPPNIRRRRHDSSCRSSAGSQHPCRSEVIKLFEDEVIKTLLASLGPTESVDPEQVQDVKHLFQVCAKDLLKKCPVIFAAYTATFFRHQPATFHSLIPWIKILQRRRRIWADLRNKAH